MSTVKKLWRIFPRAVKIRFFLLLAVIIFGALLEMAALAAVYPFISVLDDSSIIETNNILNFAYNFLKFDNNNSFLLFLAFSLVFIYVFRSVYLYIVAKIQYRFGANRQVELSERLLADLLSKSYLYHVNKNLAEFQRIVLADVNHLIGLVHNLLFFMSNFFMLTFILIYLFTLSIPMTFSVIGLALICVAIYFSLFRRKIKATGEENRITHIEMTKAVNQAVGGIKELKILRREHFFTAQFKNRGGAFARSNARFAVYTAIPRLLIEGICFGGAFLLIGLFIFMGVDMGSILPLLSVFVIAAFRLLPAISTFTGCVNSISFMKPSVDSIYKNLFENDAYDTVPAVDKENESVFEPSDDIIVDNISFQYPGTDAAVLEGVSLRIPHKKSTAFVGSTGEGKTTLVDVILGIYVPQNGSVIYNGKSIHYNLEEWTKNIGYIPQQIYLLDETILENVAYGIARNEINENRVWESLEQAQIADFIRSLPDGIMTVVGDRGVRLSGGQRQRIGIARALYTNPSILVLDEATSSLDNETEKAVMDAIDKFQGEKTMIIIAHRLSTIENCDIIYRVESGRVIKEK